MTVAALYVETGGCYFGLPGVDPWDEARDARHYDGPHPVVAHPPCDRWHMLSAVNNKRWGFRINEDGGCFASALAAVRKWGGVLEHPAQTRAFRFHGIPQPTGKGWSLKPKSWLDTCRFESCRGHHEELVSKDNSMPIMGRKMKPLDEEIWRLDAEIARLQGERAGLLRAKELLTGAVPEKSAAPRKRAPSVKPLVLDIMAQVGRLGATTSEVDGVVRQTNPDVAKDTVGSVLSRLKSEGALVYEGDRYYEKRFAPAPQPRPWEAKIVG